MKRDRNLRFWEKVEITPHCWEWTASKRHHYGQFDTKLAHRIAWELVFKYIPEGMQVLHSCDNPGCVRPSHLFLGTQKDNMVDMMKKGRHKGHHGYVRRGRR